MGIFSKIKQNLNHGGVKIGLDSPQSASMQDQTVPVTITLVNGPEPHTINSAKVEIIATSQNQGFNQATASSTSSSNATSKVVASSNIGQPFALQANETKSLPLQIVMNGTALIAEQMPEGSAAEAVVNTFQKLQSVSQALNDESWSYSVRAVADVEGIALDPAVEHPIVIFKPGEIGTVIGNKPKDF